MFQIQIQCLLMHEQIMTMHECVLNYVTLAVLADTFIQSNLHLS